MSQNTRLLATEQQPVGGSLQPRWSRGAIATTLYLAVGTVAALVAASGVTGAWEGTVLLALGVATVLAFVVSLWFRRPAHRWPWLAIVAALGLFFVAQLVRSDLNTMGNLTASRSLIPDLLDLPGYILLGGGLVGFAHLGLRAGQDQFGIILDGLIGGLAAATIAWVFAVERVLALTTAPLTVRLVLISYPSLDIFLVVITLRLALSPGQKRHPAFWFLLAGMTLMFVGDALYMLADMNLAHFASGVLDLPYSLAYLGAGAAALHPSMRFLTTPRTRLQTTRLGRGRIALVALALIVPGPLVVMQRHVDASDRYVLLGFIVALSLAAVVRVVEALQTAENSQARLAFQATHDSLTGLPNRRFMHDELSQLLARPRIDDSHIALLYIDLDQFKLINDSLGHRHGDELLIDVANRLRVNVRPTDLVTRLGGDEFMIVLGEVVSVSQALELANRLRTCLKEPFVANGVSFFVSASIGLAYASGDDRQATAEALIRDADTAMYEAKDGGRDAVAVFDESMRIRLAERAELTQDLHHAVSRGELHLVYQPITRLPQGPAVGMEALLRWAHPRYGVISPVKFIPLAEESGLIGAIGNWVLELVSE